MHVASRIVLYRRRLERGTGKALGTALLLPVWIWGVGDCGERPLLMQAVWQAHLQGAFSESLLVDLARFKLLRMSPRVAFGGLDGFLRADT